MPALANSALSSIVVGVLVVTFACVRQLQTRSVREGRGVTLYFVLLAIGVYQLVFFLQKHIVGDTVIELVAASLVVGAGLGALRGWLTHLWRANGTLLRRGNPWTIALWVVGLGIHLGIDLFSRQLDPAAEGFASSTILIYIALAIGVQRFVLLRRAKFIVEHPNEAPTQY